MAVVALKEPEVQSTMRRFALPDLDTHGAWILKRIALAFPHLNDRFLLGWIRSLLYDNANLFLYQDNGVALFQTIGIFSLAHKPIVIERFVFCQEGHVKQGAEFYTLAAEWAKSQGIEQVFVEELSDIPHDLIKEKIGRLFTRQQVFARV